MTIENTYIVDRNLKTVVEQLEEIKELLGGSSSGGGSMIINVTYNENSHTFTFDKTAGECLEAYSNGIICIVYYEDDDNMKFELINSAEHSNEDYEVYSFKTDSKTYETDSENDYPSALDLP